MKVILNSLHYEISATKRSRVLGAQSVSLLGAHLVQSLGSFAIRFHNTIENDSHSCGLKLQNTLEHT